MWGKLLTQRHEGIPSVGIGDEIFSDCCKLIRDVIIRYGKDNDIRLPFIGTFETKKVKERIWTSPSNGKKYNVPEHSKIKFRPAKRMRDLSMQYHKTKATEVD